MSQVFALQGTPPPNLATTTTNTLKRRSAAPFQGRLHSDRPRARRRAVTATSCLIFLLVHTRACFCPGRAGRAYLKSCCACAAAVWRSGLRRLSRGRTTHHLYDRPWTTTQSEDRPAIQPKVGTASLPKATRPQLKARRAPFAAQHAG